MTRDEMTDKLIAHDIETMMDQDLYYMLLNGCKGYNECIDEEIAEYYEDRFGDNG